MTTTISICLTVGTDDGYHYDVEVSEELLRLVYVEESQPLRESIGFGSFEEMEAVAKAMLNAVKLATGRVRHVAPK